MDESLASLMSTEGIDIIVERKGGEKGENLKGNKETEIKKAPIKL